jgi:thymidylate synthase (FAD)
MRLIEQQSEYLPQTNGIEGVYKHIELCGRTCYKSTDKITNNSAKPFVDRLINSKHYAMLEHGTIYLKRKMDYIFESLYEQNPYSKVVYDRGLCYVTTNLRVIIEHHILEDLKYMCEPCEYHEKRYTFRCITSIGVTREMNRHRVNSIAQQSTRYCNYSKDKFNNQVTFCIPEWVHRSNITEKDDYFESLKQAERSYLQLIQNGWQPQQAREVLPLSTATEIIHTAFASDWKHFFDLRLYGKTGAPHPNMKQLAELMKEEAEKANIWEDITKY